MHATGEECERWGGGQGERGEAREGEGGGGRQEGEGQRGPGEAEEAGRGQEEEGPGESGEGREEAMTNICYSMFIQLNLVWYSFILRSALTH